MRALPMTGACNLRRAAHVLCTLVLLASPPVAAPGASTDADAQAVLESIRERAERVETFRIQMEWPNRSDSNPALNEWVVRKEVIARLPDWVRKSTLMHPPGEPPTSRQEYVVKGNVVNILGPGERATVSPYPGVFGDYTLFPVLLREAFHRFTVESASLDGDELVVVWANPEGPEWSKTITARFTSAPPHDMSTLTISSGELHLFRDYRDTASGVRVSFEIETPRYSHKEPRTTITTVTEAALNIDIPDSAFVIRYPPGTDVHDEIAGVSYRVEDPPTAIDLDGLLASVGPPEGDPAPPAGPADPVASEAKDATGGAAPVAGGTATRLTWALLIFAAMIALLLAGVIFYRSGRTGSETP